MSARAMLGLLLGAALALCLTATGAAALMTSGLLEPTYDPVPTLMETPAFVAHIAPLQDRWFGSPAIWEAPPIAGTQIRRFDIAGTTQLELIVSLNASALCKTYSCLPDPAAPGGRAWGLAGAGLLSTSCYSPRSAIRPIDSFVVLPSWQPKPFGQVQASLVVKWNALEQVLYTHEAGHAAIAIRDLSALNDQARQLPSCQAWLDFWSRPGLFTQEEADQNAFHAQLRADCRPAIGCIPAGWMGWS